MHDLSFALQWWAIIFLIGVISLPFTALLFNNFYDKGYIFAKITGILFISYSVYILTIAKILKFTGPTIYLVIWIFFLVNFYIIKKTDFVNTVKNKIGIFLFQEIIFLSGIIFWSYIRGFEPSIHGLEKYMDYGFVNSILRTEYMPAVDMWFPPFSINYYYFGHFITAVLTKLSNLPSEITFNLMIATLFAFTFSQSFSIGSNLVNLLKMRQTNKARGGKSERVPDSAQCVRGTRLSRSTDGNETFDRTPGRINKIFISDLSVIKTLIAGFLTAFLVAFAGNLHTLYTFFQQYANDNPKPPWQLSFLFNSFPNGYWYPNATRFIYNTIHEFPIYSFVVSDLHGHVLDIPMVLLTIAILLSLILSSKNQPVISQNSNLKSQNYSSKFKTFHSFAICDLRFAILLGFLLAVMYMTNAWDGIIYFLLAALVLGVLNLKKDQIDLQSKNQKSNYSPELKTKDIKDQKYFKNLRIGNSLKIVNYSPEIKMKDYKLKIFPWLFQVFILGAAFILLTLPFNLSFKPFVSGFGVLCAPDFLTNIGKIGPFLFEKEHCQHSPWWQLMILYGFFYFWAISFIVFKLKSQDSKLVAKRYFLNASDTFVLILIALSTFLIIVPEFIYAKDIYPAHYRANTMFKLVYQSFIMLSISSAYIIIRLIPVIKFSIFNSQLSILKRIFPIIYLLFAVLLFFLVTIYPNFAIGSYYGNLKNYKGLDGIKYLKDSYPTDYEAIIWLNKNIKGQPVILEAQGDSYTDYARVSANTGLPTVLGWTVHEWLWRGTYDIPAPRITDVQTLYETEDLNIAGELIRKHNVELVFTGDLERQKYPKINEDKFKNLGKIIYSSGQTTIYKINY